MVKPIRPSDIPTSKKAAIPDFVIEAFNVLIARNYIKGRSTFTQNEVIEEILKTTTNLVLTDKELREEIFQMGWLNVEDLFKAEGWRVEYDKPGYNEDYAARFIFTSSLRSMNEAGRYRNGHEIPL